MFCTIRRHQGLPDPILASFENTFSTIIPAHALHNFTSTFVDTPPPVWEHDILCNTRVSCGFFFRDALADKSGRSMGFGHSDHTRTKKRQQLNQSLNTELNLTVLHLFKAFPSELPFSPILCLDVSVRQESGTGPGG